MFLFLKDEKMWNIIAESVDKKIKKDVNPAKKKTPKIKIKRQGETENMDIVDRKLPELVAGNIYSLDKALGERFKKGKLNIDATLDLHGLTIEEAFEKVKKFVIKQYDRQSRCVLIITGKGRFAMDDSGFVHSTGKLRKELPLWLNRSDLRSFILSFCEAKLKDGGSGAFYLYLKKKKKDVH